MKEETREKIKRKSAKKKYYLDDFKMDDDGKYRYRGAVYIYKGKDERKKAFLRLWMYGAGFTVMAVMAGWFPTGGLTNTSWVILPYAAAIVMAGIILYKVYDLQSAGDPVREYIYKRSAMRLPGYQYAHLIMIGISAASAIVHDLICGISGYTAGTIVFYVCTAVEVICNLLWEQQFRRMSWEFKPGDIVKEEKEETKQPQEQAAQEKKSG